MAIDEMIADMALIFHWQYGELMEFTIEKLIKYHGLAIKRSEYLLK